MKKLKLTINGKVNTFDLPGNGEYKCEVEESYVPKKGDCVMIKNKEHDVLYWCKLTEATNIFSACFKIYVNSSLETYKNGFFCINKNRIFTQITTEELKAKYAEAGYDWDYESDTIKPLKWMPKDGDEVWYLNSIFEPIKSRFDKNNTYFQIALEKGFLFKTEEECQKFCDYCLEYFKK